MKCLADDAGSLTPLGLGMIIFTTLMLLSIITASSLFIFQKRLTTFAESAVLFVANSGADVSGFVALFDSGRFKDLKIHQSLAPDNLTVQVEACALWKPLFLSSGEIAEFEICSHAAARSGT